MFEERIDMWDDETADAICITTNGIVRKDGTLVMGAGTAGMAQSRFPELPARLGKRIMEDGNHCYPIYTINDQTLEKKFLISFPTKNDWKDNSDIELIRQSSVELMEWICLFGLKRVLLPRPGCGLGFLDWETQVKPVIEPILDDRVVVVSF